jgi:hypothetical protein
MFTVKLSDGQLVELPKPEGERLQQLGLRVIYLNNRAEELKEEKLIDYIDDIVYLVLDHWKQKGVKKPFDKLHTMVVEDRLNFDNLLFKQAFEDRVKDTFSFVCKFKEGDKKVKDQAKVQLKERGFIGERKIKKHTKAFLLKAGIQI